MNPSEQKFLLRPVYRPKGWRESSRWMEKRRKKRDWLGNFWKSCIFISPTCGSQLEKLMQEKEAEMRAGGREEFPIKIIETAGKTLERTLVNSDPFNGNQCNARMQNADLGRIQETRSTAGEMECVFECFASSACGLEDPRMSPNPSNVLATMANQERTCVVGPKNMSASLTARLRRLDQNRHSTSIFWTPIAAKRMRKILWILWSGNPKSLSWDWWKKEVHCESQGRITELQKQVASTQGGQDEDPGGPGRRRGCAPSPWRRRRACRSPRSRRCRSSRRGQRSNPGRKGNRKVPGPVRLFL